MLRWQRHYHWPKTLHSSLPSQTCHFPSSVWTSQAETSPRTPLSLFKLALKEPGKRRADKQMTRSLYLQVSIMGGHFCLFYFQAHSYSVRVDKSQWNKTRPLWNRDSPRLIHPWISEITTKGLNFHIITCVPPSPPPQHFCTTHSAQFYSTGNSKRSPSIFLIATCCPRIFTFQDQAVLFETSVWGLSSPAWPACWWHRQFSVMLQTSFIGTQLVILALPEKLPHLPCIILIPPTQIFNKYNFFLHYNTSKLLAPGWQKT